MTNPWLAAIAGAVTILAMVELLRRHRVKEKYTILWLVAGLAVAILATVPQLLDVLADGLGVRSGPNLLFLIAVIALGLVSVHLSVEVSRLEDQSRTLAEEVGMLNLAINRLERQLGQQRQLGKQ
jgi:hypothetical protein